mmetsp:Transcript_4381/g.11299  ORF Transcript_4381/g.11299 Transcript_4381/m.11299 type:complete len:341 (+) Transcript_4381:258-1280(+)
MAVPRHNPFLVTFGLVLLLLLLLFVLFFLRGRHVDRHGRRAVRGWRPGQTRPGTPFPAPLALNPALQDHHVLRIEVHGELPPDVVVPGYPKVLFPFDEGRQLSFFWVPLKVAEIDADRQGRPVVHGRQIATRRMPERNEGFGGRHEVVGRAPDIQALREDVTEDGGSVVLWNRVADVGIEPPVQEFSLTHAVVVNDFHGIRPDGLPDPNQIGRIRIGGFPSNPLAHFRTHRLIQQIDSLDDGLPKFRSRPVHDDSTGILEVQIKRPSRLSELVVDDVYFVASLLSGFVLPNDRPPSIQGMFAQFSFRVRECFWNISRFQFSSTLVVDSTGRYESIVFRKA